MFAPLFRQPPYRLKLLLLPPTTGTVYLSISTSEKLTPMIYNGCHRKPYLYRRYRDTFIRNTHNGVLSYTAIVRYLVPGVDNRSPCASRAAPFPNLICSFLSFFFFFVPSCHLRCFFICETHGHANGLRRRIGGHKRTSHTSVQYNRTRFRVKPSDNEIDSTDLSKLSSSSSSFYSPLFHAKKSQLPVSHAYSSPTVFSSTPHTLS